MKKFRILLCVIMLGIVFAVMTACGKGPESTDDPVEGGYNGEAFYFIASFIPGNDERDKDLVYSAGGSDSVSISSIETEVMYDHCEKVEKEYNCRIVRQGGLGSYDSNSAFAAAYAAGTQQANFISADTMTLLDLYKSGIIADLSTIEAIDLSDTEKWGATSLRTATTSKGVLYAIPMQGSRYMPIQKAYNGAFYYNADLYNTFGVDRTPREMIEQGDWTFDDFYNLLLNVYDPDETNRIYGFGLKNSIVTATIYANGGDVIVRDKGKYLFGYTKDNAITALEWARKLTKTDGMMGTLQDFEDGKAVFCLAPVSDAIYSQIKSLSWVPFPYGPDVEQGSTYVSYFGHYEGSTAIFKHENDPDKDQRTGVIFNALFEPTEFYGKDGYDKYMERNFFNSAEDYAVYKANVDNMHYTWSKEFSASDILTSLSESCDAMLRSSSAILPYVSAYEDAVEQIANEELGGR